MIYQVGGCVRDEVMGRTPKDIDYVVVGASEKDMLDMGFQKVGADFPVYLHPATREEYALARTEKKTGKGYLGFETYFGPDVTLEQDLERRDFTMNAMAKRNGDIVDPFDGQADIANGVIRRVNDKAFIEDPVRILRAARFAARYDFIVDSETVELIKSIDVTEIDSVPRERVMLELKKALDDGKGYKFLSNLESFNDCIFCLFFGFCFGQRLWAIDAVYKELGMDGAMVLMAEIAENNFLTKNKASQDCKMLYTLITKASQRHVFEPQDAFELIRMSDYYRRPQFLEQADKYLKLTSINLVSVAMQLATVTHEQFPELQGAEIGKAIQKKRKEVFDSILGL